MSKQNTDKTSLLKKTLYIFNETSHSWLRQPVRERCILKCSMWSVNLGKSVCHGWLPTLIVQLTITTHQYLASREGVILMEVISFITAICLHKILHEQSMVSSQPASFPHTGSMSLFLPFFQTSPLSDFYYKTQWGDIYLNIFTHHKTRKVYWYYPEPPPEPPLPVGQWTLTTANAIFHMTYPIHIFM